MQANHNPAQAGGVAYYRDPYTRLEETMFVSRSMTGKVVTISPQALILDAQKMMVDKQIRHLPVVEKDDILVGMITDRDIRSALPPGFIKQTLRPEELERLAGLTVGEVMSRKLITISPTDTIQDALLIIQQHRVGALPVVDEDHRLKGIISVRDLLRAFINVLGIGEPGTLLGILVEEKIGQLKRIVDAITEENISIGSVLVARYWEEGQRAVFAYLLTNNVAKIKKKLAAMGYTILDPMDWYMDKLPPK
ncbi:MAG: CBS and ACT domain-containing protein [Desulfobacterales bacterium]|nr:CBS and ACT domain-containing protein [Desulfobacterales bacterium]